MRSFVTTLFCASLLVFSVGANAFGWPKDYGAVPKVNAFTNAKANGKPVAIYYSLTYCPGCRNMERQLRDDEAYSKWGGKFNFVSLDPGADSSHAEREEIAQKWGRIMTPTLFLFSPEGHYVCYRVGSFNNQREAVEFPQKLLPMLTSKNRATAPRDCSTLLQS